MTDCVGATVVVTLPGEAIDERIPEPYTPEWLDGLGGQVLLELHTCAKVSVDGRDEGPAFWHFVFVPILEPAGEDAAEGTKYRYVAEIGTDHSILREWFAAQGLSPVSSGGTLATSILPGQPWFGRMTGSVTLGGVSAYAFDGYLQDAHLSVQQHQRLLFGQDPTRQVLGGGFNAMLSASSVAEVTVAPQTALSDFVAGAPVIAAMPNTVVTTFYLLEPPVPEKKHA